MRTITEMAEAVKYFELAIEDMKEALANRIEQDEEYLAYRQKFMEKHNYCFLFFKHSMEFEFYKFRDHSITHFFKINQNGEIIYNQKNSFEGIEKAAMEAQKIVSKFYQKIGSENK